jgi:hypothetical protein
MGGQAKGRKGVVTTQTLVIKDLLPQGRILTGTKGEIQKLADDIALRGLDRPIITCDGAVLDGLKRIQAFQLLGRTEIPAMVSDSYPELCLALAEVLTEEMPVNRLLFTVETLHRPKVAFVKARKAASGRGKTGLKGPGEGVAIRKLLRDATGVSEGRLEIALGLVAHAKTDPVIAIKLQEIRNGTETLYGYQRWRINRNESLQAPVAPAEEVRQIMDRGLRTLDTTIETISKFGPVTVLTLSERRQISEMLSERWRKLRQLENLIRKGIEQEMEEQ